MVKGLNNDAAAIKMADNPADLQAVILNEIIIISALFSLLTTYIIVMLLKCGLCSGFIKKKKKKNLDKGHRWETVLFIMREVADFF